MQIDIYVQTNNNQTSIVEDISTIASTANTKKLSTEAKVEPTANISSVANMANTVNIPTETSSTSVSTASIVTNKETSNDDSTALENRLISMALTDEKVLGARCVFVNDAYVVAIITTPFYLKSERDQWCYAMQNFLSSQTDLTVHVSLDLDIYRNIRQGMDDKDKEELLESVLSRKATVY